MPRLPARLRCPALVALLVSFASGTALLSGQLRAAPVTRHVSTCADAGGGSLHATIAASSSGDTVVFDQDCIIGLGSMLAIPSSLDLTIDTLDPARAVILDGGVQILRTQATNNAGPTDTLNGFTFRNGKASRAGGAVFDDQATLTVTSSTFLNNQAATGGGAIENGRAR
jgi:hypothetical protein